MDQPDIEVVDPKTAADDSIAAVAALRRAQEDELGRNDPPRPPEEFVHDVRNDWGPQWKSEYHLARRGGEPVALASWHLDTVANPSHAWVNAYVRPADRRRGLAASWPAGRWWAP